VRKTAGIQVYKPVIRYLIPDFHVRVQYGHSVRVLFGIPFKIIGIIHDDYDQVAAPLIAGLRALDQYCVGINEPYSPADRVYYTLDRHASAQGLAAVMIEIRNDLITTPKEEKAWAGTLSAILKEIAQGPLSTTRKAANRIA
jgi:predicted N-formylglutamate amidohydrolase